MKLWETTSCETKEEYIKLSKEDELEYIASAIKDGWTNGSSPKWNLILDELDYSESTFKEIAKQVKDGSFCGYNPAWKLMVSRWSYEDEDLDKEY